MNTDEAAVELEAANHQIDILFTELRELRHERDEARARLRRVETVRDTWHGAYATLLWLSAPEDDWDKGYAAARDNDLTALTVALKAEHEATEGWGQSVAEAAAAPHRNADEEEP